MKLRLEPFSDIIVVQPLDPDRTTRGGLYLPDTAMPQKLRGRVVAVGPGRLRDDGSLVPMDVKVGDLVLYQKYSGDEYSEGGEDYRVLHQTNLFGKFVE